MGSTDASKTKRSGRCCSLIVVGSYHQTSQASQARQTETDPKDICKVDTNTTSKCLFLRSSFFICSPAFVLQYAPRFSYPVLHVLRPFLQPTIWRDGSRSLLLSFTYLLSPSCFLSFFRSLFFPSSQTGEDAANWLISTRLAKGRTSAIAFGELLLAGNLIRDLDNTGTFQTGKRLYGFVAEDEVRNRVSTRNPFLDPTFHTVLVVTKERARARDTRLAFLSLTSILWPSALRLIDLISTLELASLTLTCDFRCADGCWQLLVHFTGARSGKSIAICPNVGRITLPLHYRSPR